MAVLHVKSPSSNTVYNIELLINTDHGTDLEWPAQFFAFSNGLILQVNSITVPANTQDMTVTFPLTFLRNWVCLCNAQTNNTTNLFANVSGLTGAPNIHLSTSPSTNITVRCMLLSSRFEPWG